MRPLRVLFLASQGPGSVPGQRFRFEQWLGLLPEGAVDARILPLFGPRAAARLYGPGIAAKAAVTAAGLAKRIAELRLLSRADVVFIYRDAFPLGPALLEGLIERRVPVVFDFDDAIFLRDASAAGALGGMLKMPGRVGGIVARAAATTVGNEYLAAYARRFSSRVHVLPTTLDVETYRPQPRSREQGLVRVGWSGSRSTSKHLRTIEGALRRILAELPVELVVIGDTDFRLPGAEHFRVLPWQAATEVADVGAFDIGLMPLPDDDWSRGKCGFKALLYMSLGVAAIVSPVGVNTEIVRDGVNGLLADGEDGWVAAVGTLAADPALRQRLGEAGRQSVIDGYSGQQWAPRFLEVLQEAAETRG